MSTSLMPIDPALSPQQVTRLLPIRANLLPDEITSRRQARRMRAIVVVGVVLVMVAIGGWYVVALRDGRQAQQDLTAANTQIAQASNAMKTGDLADVTKKLDANREISAQLKTLMTNDLPWSTLLNRLRTTGTDSHVTITRITASLADSRTTPSSLPSTTTASTIATLSIEGSAADKKTIAGFIDNLGQTPGIANPFLTTATQSANPTSKIVTFGFTANADVTSVMLCGRFSTTPCKTGGK